MNESNMITLRWLKSAHARFKGQVERWNYAGQPEPVHEWVAKGECEVVEWAHKPAEIKAAVVEMAPKDRMVYRRPKKKIAPSGKAPSKE